MLNATFIKRTVITLGILLCFMGYQSVLAQVKIGTNPTVITSSSILELESTSQGLLLPRLHDTLAINALNPPDGTLIYFTGATSGLYVRRNGHWNILAGTSGKVGINFQINADSTLTIVYNDGSTHTTSKIVGSKGDKGDPGLQGEKGDPGLQGRGVKEMQLNADSTLTIVYTDESSVVIPQRIIGRDGLQGTGIDWKGAFDMPPAEPKTNWAYYDSIQGKSFIYTGTEWQMFAQDGRPDTSTQLIFNGNRPITASVFNGINPGTDDLAKWVEYLFYPSQGPTSALSITHGTTTGATITLEKMADGTDLDAVLNWEAGRRESTKLLSSVVVASDTTAFTQPDENTIVNGTKDITIERNVNTTFSIEVETEDHKRSSSTVNFRFLWKRYWGFVATTLANEDMFTPTNAEILDLSQELATARGFTKTANPNGAKRLVIAYPLAWDSGDMEIKISGFDQKGAFDRQVISVTNASGATTDYVVYTAKNNTSAAVSFSVL